MGSYTKFQLKQQEEIHAKIVEAHRRGVCDSEGRSIKTTGGRMIAKPRFSPSSAVKRYRYDYETKRMVEVGRES